ncbi:NAD(P)H-hydrate epimerase [Planctomycetes bacterium K23_9]|uniref:NAD(P)H-hydrate epimerase n=1 Tax=Stieleria marina TaxID=1930275 RepID=A0A517NWQ6_9BACT|nr:Bifunctional NAD(P)H-hydrate repair enzyme Nnr [Planctomycetes bacterium K23_9]
MEIRPLSRDEVRQIDNVAIEQYGITGLMLMENAGSGAARLVNEIAPAGKVAILCGKGNNAGDGYVIARHMELLDREVKLISIVDTESLTGDAKANFQIADRSKLPIIAAADRVRLAQELTSADIIVDCLLGTGATGSLRGLFADAVAIANQTDAIRIAIDVPTGIDCDTGQIMGEAFCAHETITFVAHKLAMQIPECHQTFGRIHVVGIGASKTILQRFA